MKRVTNLTPQGFRKAINDIASRLAVVEAADGVSAGPSRPSAILAPQRHKIEVNDLYDRASKRLNARALPDPVPGQLGNFSTTRIRTAINAIDAKLVDIEATSRVSSADTTTITADPTSIVANGTSTSTITVQAKDPNGDNLSASGGAVTLATTAGTLGAVTDNANGTYTATLTSAAAPATATVTGTIGGVAIVDSATVTFT